MRTNQTRSLHFFTSHHEQILLGIPFRGCCQGDKAAVDRAWLSLVWLKCHNSCDAFPTGPHTPTHGRTLSFPATEDKHCVLHAPDKPWWLFPWFSALLDVCSLRHETTWTHPCIPSIYSLLRGWMHHQCSTRVYWNTELSFKRQVRRQTRKECRWSV